GIAFGRLARVRRARGLPFPGDPAGHREEVFELVGVLHATCDRAAVDGNILERGETQGDARKVGHIPLRVHAPVVERLERFAESSEHLRAERDRSARRETETNLQGLDPVAIALPLVHHAETGLLERAIDLVELELGYISRGELDELAKRPHEVL